VEIAGLSNNCEADAIDVTASPPPALLQSPLDRSTVALGTTRPQAAPVNDVDVSNYPSAPPPGPTQLSPSIIATPPSVNNALLVRSENQQAGSTAWQVSNYSTAGEIQGYAGATSVNVESSIQFYVSTKFQGTTYRIDFFRMGWYSGGLGAWTMRPTRSRSCTNRPQAPPSSA
jgi:hypothetical protein